MQPHVSTLLHVAVLLTKTMACTVLSGLVFLVECVSVCVCVCVCVRERERVRESVKSYSPSIIDLSVVEL